MKSRPSRRVGWLVSRDGQRRPAGDPASHERVANLCDALVEPGIPQRQTGEQLDILREELLAVDEQHTLGFPGFEDRGGGRRVVDDLEQGLRESIWSLIPWRKSSRRAISVSGWMLPIRRARL